MTAIINANHHVAEAGPVVDEVAVCEDGVRLRKVRADQRHDGRQLRFIGVRPDYHSLEECLERRNRWRRVRGGAGSDWIEN